MASTCLTVEAAELWNEISNNVVCVTSKGSDQPAHMHSLIRAFASRLNIRVSTSSGNHGKPGKSQKNVSCMEKS